MFESLSSKLQDVFRKLTSRGKLTEADVAEACREIRLVLLEADVNFRVVKDFVTRVRERAVGAEVLASLTPAQQVIKIVNEELTALLGGADAKLAVSPKPPTVYLLVGLQGGGKTTTAAKLAAHLRRQGHQPLLVATDVYRPAAVDQLQAVGSQVGVPVFAMGTQASPVDIARASVSHAVSHGHSHVLVDTAGRLHVNEELMAELAAQKQALSPAEVLLVVDAMTGQDAVNVAEQFNEALGVTGFVITKMDGDARGGAALSIRAVTGKPIKLVGVGEKLEALEPFHPDRMASRILGMGDVLTLIERAEQAFDERKAAELERKLRTRRFDLNDFMEQMQQVNRMGPLEQVLDMVPGIGNLKRKMGGNLEVDQQKLRQMQAVLTSMTHQERSHPEIINGSRRRRIAAGSGTTVQTVNQVLGQFNQMKQMFAQLSDMEKGGKRPKLRFPFA